MLNPVTRAYGGPFRGRIRGRKEKRPLIGVTRGRSKIVMLNALCEMRMRMGNVNGIQCCRIPIYGTNQMRMAFSFAFGGGFGSHPDWPHSHLGKLGPNRPRPLNGLRLVSGFNIRAIVTGADPVHSQNRLQMRMEKPFTFDLSQKSLCGKTETHSYFPFAFAFRKARST